MSRERLENGGGGKGGTLGEGRELTGCLEALAESALASVGPGHP